MSPNTIASHNPALDERPQLRIPEEDLQPRSPKKEPTPEGLENSEEASQERQHSSKSRWQKAWWAVPIVAVALAIGSFAYVRIGNEGAEQPAAEAAAPISVRTAEVTRSPIRDWSSSEGLVQAVRFKHLAFDAAGDVTYIADRDGRTLRAGDRVRAGELLAQVDDRTLQADINQARSAIAEARQRTAAASADVASAQTQVAQAQAQVDQAIAQLNQAQSAQTLAQTNLNRYQTLFGQGAIAATELDARRNSVQDASAQVAAAQSQVAAARVQVETAQAGVQAAQGQRQAIASQVETAQARLTQAEVALEDTRLYAPFDGIVAYMNLRENEYYSPQAVSSQLSQDYGAILDRIPIVVVDPSEYEVTADFAAYRGEQVEVEQTALIAADQMVGSASLADESNSSLLARADARGEVFAVNPAVDPGGRAIEVTARVTEGENQLRHGQNVTLWVAVAENENATVVPLGAVVYRNQQPSVFVVNPQTNEVEQRSVDIGIEGLSSVEIIGDVAPGEQVVTAGQNRLVDGAQVQIARPQGIAAQ